MEYQAFAIAAPAGTPAGAEIGFGEINLKLNIEGDGYGQREYYTDKDLVRLVTADGQGDLALFDEVDLASPTAGSLRPALALQFDHVDTIAAGGAFDIYVTLTNNEPGPVILNALYGGRVVIGFGSVTGEHARSFRFVPCVEDCVPEPVANQVSPGSHRLGAGESITYLMGTYFYENEAHFDGQLRLSNLRLLVHDHVGRHGMVQLPAEPIVVEVRSSGSDPALATRSDSPPLPLENHDLTKAGDRLLIYDPNTGLEWLKLTVAAGLDATALLAETRPGRRFENFKLASSEQVETLVLNHINANGGRLPAYALYSTAPPDQQIHWQSLLQLLGPMPMQTQGLGAIGLVSDPPDASLRGEGLRTMIEITAPETVSRGGPIMFSAPGQIQKHTFNPAHQNNYGYTGLWLVRE